MVNFRRSKKIGPFRFTMSNRGLGTSVGSGPVRFSRSATGKLSRTLRIPGTGVSDTRAVGKGKKKSPRDDDDRGAGQAAPVTSSPRRPAVRGDGGPGVTPGSRAAAGISRPGPAGGGPRPASRPGTGATPARVPAVGSGGSGDDGGDGGMSNGAKLGAGAGCGCLGFVLIVVAIVLGLTQCAPDDDATQNEPRSVMTSHSQTTTHARATTQNTPAQSSVVRAPAVETPTEQEQPVQQEQSEPEVDQGSVGGEVEQQQQSGGTGRGGQPTYANCDEVRAANAAPITQGVPGYRKKFDRDGDGVGCDE